MGHKTRISGTNYEISGGKVMVGGTAYSIAKGKAMVGGTVYSIEFNASFEFFIKRGGTNVRYMAYSGMTWRQWVLSTYNTGNYSVINGGVAYVDVMENSTLRVHHNDTYNQVVPDETIVPNGYYLEIATG